MGSVNLTTFDYGMIVGAALTWLGMYLPPDRIAAMVKVHVKHWRHDVRD